MVRRLLIGFVALSSLGCTAEVDSLSVDDAQVSMLGDDPTRAMVTFEIVSPIDDAVVGVALADPSLGQASIVVGASTGSDVHDHGSVDGVISLPKQTTIQLSATGTHVMIEQLAAPLQPGDEIPLTLKLVDGQPVEITATVR